MVLTSRSKFRKQSDRVQAQKSTTLIDNRPVSVRPVISRPRRWFFSLEIALLVVHVHDDSRGWCVTVCGITHGAHNLPWRDTLPSPQVKRHQKGDETHPSHPHNAVDPSPGSSIFNFSLICSILATLGYANNISSICHRHHCTPSPLTMPPIRRGAESRTKKGMTINRQTLTWAC